MRRVLALALLPACYSPEFASCVHACTTVEACPPGLNCVGGQCVVPGEVCQPPGDAPPADAGPPTDGSPGVMDLPATADAWLSSVDFDMNFGTVSSLELECTLNSEVSVMLIKFDLSPVSGRTLASAEFHFAVEDGIGPTIQVYPVSETWDEFSVTYRNRYGMTSWAGPGARDASRLPLAGQGNDDDGWIELQVDDVQRWLDGEVANEGMVVVCMTEDPAGHDFAISSREGSSAPFLRVTF